MIRVLALLTALTACKPSMDHLFDTDVERVVVRDGMLTTTTWRTQTDADARLEVPVEVGADTTSFLVSLTTMRHRPVLLSIHDPAGQLVLHADDWLGADELLTDAFEIARKTTAASWPVRAVDEPLTPGTWRTLWQSGRESGELSPDDITDVVVMTKDDPDLTHGTITVHLVWAEGVEDRPARHEVVHAAVDAWIVDWARYGLEVVPIWHSAPVDPQLPFTYGGGDEVYRVSRDVAAPGDFIVFLGDWMVYKPNIFGTSAGMPGSPYPGRYHFVAIALDMFIGPTGLLYPDGQQMLVDTLAHEVAHFMGLAHVVSQEWDKWDALDDTPRCSSKAQCEQQLGTNLMFPFSYCPSSCSTRSLTPQQQAVLHHYVGTR